MITKKLTNLFLVSLILVYLHGIEEIINGFQHKDSFMIVGADTFQTTPEIFYWTAHIIWWLLLPILFILFIKTRIGLFLLTLYGLVFVFELHHLIKALLLYSYYPGMTTTIFYIILGVFYWKELLLVWRKNYDRN